MSDDGKVNLFFLAVVLVTSIAHFGWVAGIGAWSAVYLLMPYPVGRVR